MNDKIIPEYDPAAILARVHIPKTMGACRPDCAICQEALAA